MYGVKGRKRTDWGWAGWVRFGTADGRRPDPPPHQHGRTPTLGTQSSARGPTRGRDFGRRRIAGDRDKGLRSRFWRRPPGPAEGSPLVHPR